MKKTIVVALVFFLAFAGASASAAEKASLGVGNIAVKVGYIEFTDGDVEDADIDKALYIGLEGYTQLVPQLYLGLEAGYARPEGEIGPVDSELTYVPVELNAKYALPISPYLVVDLGAGISYNYAEFEFLNDNTDDWVFGGQFFVDVNYMFEKIFIGFNGKYQVTEEFKSDDVELSNWRLGGHIGYMF
ncbi:MAG: outer membrane protein [Nitrospirota bacterium]